MIVYHVANEENGTEPLHRFYTNRRFRWVQIRENESFCVETAKSTLKCYIILIVPFFHHFTAILPVLYTYKFIYQGT